MAVDLTNVTILLLKSDLDYLLGFCDTHRIAVGGEKRESKPAVLKLVMRYLNSEEIEDSDDGGKAIVDKIVEDLGGEVKEDVKVMPELEDPDKKVTAVPEVKATIKIEPSDKNISETLS